MSSWFEFTAEKYAHPSLFKEACLLNSVSILLSTITILEEPFPQLTWKAVEPSHVTSRNYLISRNWLNKTTAPSVGMQICYESPGFTDTDAMTQMQTFCSTPHNTFPTYKRFLMSQRMTCTTCRDSTGGTWRMQEWSRIVSTTPDENHKFQVIDRLYRPFHWTLWSASDLDVW